jgi:putative phage-type endonuclease
LILKPQSREAWLEARRRGIGGSDAGAVIGANKYRSNVDAWKEKTGLIVPEDVGDKPAVKFGKEAEQHIRALFALEHPEMTVEYHEFYMYLNDKHPFLYATLDGELTDDSGRRGILEIKTATIQNAAGWSEWVDGIPQSYYAQVIHQLAATGWDFVILFAYLRTPYSGNVARLVERRIERADVADDITYLIAQETEFWQAVETKQRPPLKLPEI